MSTTTQETEGQKGAGSVGAGTESKEGQGGQTTRVVINKRGQIVRKAGRVANFAVSGSRWRRIVGQNARSVSRVWNARPRPKRLFVNNPEFEVATTKDELFATRSKANKQMLSYGIATLFFVSFVPVTESALNQLLLSMVSLVLLFKGVFAGYIGMRAGSQLDEADK